MGESSEKTGVGAHAAKQTRTRRRRGGKRFLIPAVVGVVTFGAVTAFAASLAVNSKSLGSGNANVNSCNASAAVSYNTAYSATVPGYKVTTAPVTSAVACATLSYKVTLTGTGNSSLGEVSGTLDSSGNASPDFSASNISAANVTGVSVLITG
jgi:hypothetical protein